MRETVDMGDVLKTSFEVIRENLATFILLASFIILPNIVVALGSGLLTPYLVPTDGGPPDLQGYFAAFSALLPAYLISMLVTIITYTIAQAGMTFAAVEHMAGRNAGASRSMTAAFRSFLPLLAGGLVSGLAITLGFVLCIIPGLILTIFLCLTTPAILVERLGPIAAIKRSIELTDGHKVTIVLVFLALIGIAIALSCVTTPISSALMFRARAEGVAFDPWSPLQIGITIVRTVIYGALTAYGTTAIAVIYTRIRGIRDGMDAEAFARVFA